MAAPASKTLQDLNGTWFLNKSLSDDVDPALQIQGIGWMTRKAIGLASVTLHVRQYVSDEDQQTHIDIDQTATGGLKGTSEQRTLDNEWSEHKDWLFGRVRGRSQLVTDIPDDEVFLKKGWEQGTAEWVYNCVESLDDGWTAKQTWGFQLVNGERRHVRNVLVAKDGKQAELKMVYDFVSDQP